MIRRAIFGSAVLHLTVIAAASIVWPHVLDLPGEPLPVIPVELVTVAEETNIKPTVAEQPTPEAPPPEEAPQQATPEQAKAPPPPEPAPEPALTPEEKFAAQPQVPVKPRLKPPPPKKEQPKSKFDLNNILALLDQSKPKSAAAANATQSDRTIKGVGAQNAFTMSEVDALLAQMRECWNVPVGAPDPERLIVQVRVFLTPDGHLEQAPQLLPQSRAAAAADPYMRAAAEAALRAVNVCEPYHLPTDKYDSWHEIVMTFDPSKMVGR